MCTSSIYQASARATSFSLVISVLAVLYAAKRAQAEPRPHSPVDFSSSVGVETGLLCKQCAVGKGKHVHEGS